MYGHPGIQWVETRMSTLWRPGSPPIKRSTLIHPVPDLSREKSEVIPAALRTAIVQVCTIVLNIFSVKPGRFLSLSVTDHIDS